MHPEPILIDAQHARTQLHRWHAHRHLAEQATTHDHTSPRGVRYRFGSTLIAAGRRLQGVAPALPERPSLPSTQPSVRPVH